MRRLSPSVSYDKWELRELRKDPVLALAYLNGAILLAFEENDPEVVLLSLSTVAKAYGFAKVAKGAKLKRESLHRMLSKRGNPEWNSLFRVLRALHLRPKMERAGRRAAV